MLATSAGSERIGCKASGLVLYTSLTFIAMYPIARRESYPHRCAGSSTIALFPVVEDLTISRVIALRYN